MTSNLVQHRGEQSIWDRADERGEWDAERWLVAIMAGAFLNSGFRRRSLSGLMLVMGGGCLAWWATTGADQRRHHRERLRAAWPANHVDGDTVRDQSEESFPASDAPSWTPITGNSGPASQRR